MRGCKLVLFTNGTWHTGFRLAPKSATVNDLELRNGRYFTEFGPLEAYYIKVVEVRSILSATEM